MPHCHVRTRQNYRTENLDIDVVHIALPYNAILGYLALAKFMAVTHHAYNMVKLPGRDGIITIRGEVDDAVRFVEHAYKEVAVLHPTAADDDGSLGRHVRPGDAPQRRLRHLRRRRRLRWRAGKRSPLRSRSSDLRVVAQIGRAHV